MRTITLGLVAFCAVFGLVLGVVVYLALLPHMLIVGYMLLVFVGLVALCGVVLAVVFTYSKCNLIIMRWQDERLRLPVWPKNDYR